MDRAKSKELINYFRNRPKEARELAEILLKSIGKDKREKEDTERGATRWLTASEVGKEMGRTGQWVKDRDDIIPESAKRRGTRNCHMYLWNDNTRQLFTNQL